ARHRVLPHLQSDQSLLSPTTVRQDTTRCPASSKPCRITPADTRHPRRNCPLLRQTAGCPMLKSPSCCERSGRNHLRLERFRPASAGTPRRNRPDKSAEARIRKRCAAPESLSWSSPEKMRPL